MASVSDVETAYSVPSATIPVILGAVWRGPMTVSREDLLVQRRADAVVAETVRAGAILYDRERDLARLIRIDPLSPLPDGETGTVLILAKLDRALRAERSRARSGRWTYDLNRHIALRQAQKAEQARLDALRRP